MTGRTLSFSAGIVPDAGLYQDYGEYTKVADLRTDMGQESKTGIFCGLQEGDWLHVCIKDSAISGENWFFYYNEGEEHFEMLFASPPVDGSNVDYTAHKFLLFDPETLSSNVETYVGLHLKN